MSTAVIDLEDSECCHHHQHVAIGRMKLTQCSSSLQVTRDLVKFKYSHSEQQHLLVLEKQDLVKITLKLEYTGANIKIVHLKASHASYAPPSCLLSHLLSHLLTPTSYIPSLKISSHLHRRRLYGQWGDPQPQCIGANVLPSEHNLALTSSFALCLFCLSLALWHMAVHDLPQIHHHVDSNYQFDWVSHCVCATGMNGLVMLDLDFLTVHRAFLYV